MKAFRPGHRILLPLLILSLVIFFHGYSGISDSVRFVFMTDIHLHSTDGSTAKFDAAIALVNSLSPKAQFVIVGGDLVKDANEATINEVQALFDLYEKSLKKFKMPVYNIIGNHDIHGLADHSRELPPDTPVGKYIFMRRLGEGTTYRSFDIEQWHFILLDSVDTSHPSGIRGLIPPDEFEWLRDDLAKAGKSRPVCIALHIPLVSLYPQIFSETTITPPSQGALVNNGTQVLRLLSDYNVRLVLQGHLHILEELKYKNTTFITASSVSEPASGHQAGFVVVDVKGNDLTWEFKKLEGT